MDTNNNQNNKVEIDTVFGKLFAETSGDSDYPGIYICIEQEDEFGKYERQLVLIESTPDIDTDNKYSLRALVWSKDIKDGYEDYTDSFVIREKNLGG